VFPDGHLATATLRLDQSGNPGANLLSACLLARSLSNTRAARLLFDAGHVVEARILVRTSVENLIYLGALGNEGETFVKKMLHDEAWSSLTRGQGLFDVEHARDGMPRETASNLSRFLKQVKTEWPDATSLNPKAVAKDNDVRAAYIFYQELSSDAAHPSLTALNRYLVQKDENKIVELNPAPPILIGEAQSTLCLAAMSLLGACAAANQLLGETSGGAGLNSLGEAYMQLASR
jgi:Family of unknown function (DUF5677)